MTPCTSCGILERVGGPFVNGICWRCLRERERGANMARDTELVVGRPPVQRV